MGASASSNTSTANRRPRPAASYRYPPEDGGNYFSTHYYLGHRKFECGDPELFLFGELPDLNYLPAKPSTFPYKQPPKSQPVSCLRSYINIQRESLKLVKSGPSESNDYHIEFTFDTDVSCTFTILKAVPDSLGMSNLSHEHSSSVSDDEMTLSAPFPYPSGSDQQFKQTDYIVTPAEIDEDKLTYDPESDHTHFPLVILMQTSKEHSDIKQSQVTICSLEKSNDNGYSIKVLKQKLIADGVEYLLQEVYGLENKAHENTTDSEGEDSDTEEDLGAECVICITDVRDTILLPCRHLCLCSSCAANLRYQSSNCPICRAPFRALLQIQALEPLDPDLVLDDDEATGNPKYSVPGYQCVPLLQALNGYNLEEREELDEVNETEEDTGPQPETVEDAVNQASPTPRPTEDVCVVPIEDEPQETDGSSSQPAHPPVRTTFSQQSSRGKVYVVDEEMVPLPGTPVNDQHHVTISLEDRGGDLDWKTDSSHCGSSVSSEVSVKSSDMLLPANRQ